MACPNGAEVDPVFTLTTVALNVVSAGIAVEEGWLSIVPWLTNSPILGQQTTSSLCALNLDDPGDFQLSMLATPVDLNLLPSYDSAPGSLNRWIWDKTAYFFFQRACRCIGTQTKPPPPVVVTTPPGADTSPGQPGNADQLTRIENQQHTSSSALLTLYNGLQMGLTDVRDMAYRYRPSMLIYDQVDHWTMSGEGSYSLTPFKGNVNNISYDALGIVVHLTSIPPTVARRGTTNQRLYGVGSIEWNCESTVGQPNVIAQRDSLHYVKQFIRAPSSVYGYDVLWRLMPGVTAEAWQIRRNPDVGIYVPLQPVFDAYQEFSQWTPPQNWSDPPFYPLPTARKFVSVPPTLPP